MNNIIHIPGAEQINNAIAMNRKYWPLRGYCGDCGLKMHLDVVTPDTLNSGERDLVCTNPGCGSCYGGEDAR